MRKVKEEREDAHLTLGERIKRDKWLLLIFLPGILNVLLFQYVPMFGIMIAFQDYKPLVGFIKSPWVGWANFQRLFQGEEFLKILWNTITLNIQSLLITFPIPIVFALLLNEMRGRKFKRVTQTIVYLPHFITVIIVAGMVKEFLSPSTGFIAKAFNALGMFPGAGAGGLLTVPWAAHGILIGTSLWQGFGWDTIIYLASLSGVDPQIYEAAMIDGASRFQRVIHITLPALAPVVSIQLIMAIGGLMGSGFDLPFLLQNGSNMDGMEVLATYVYKQGIASYAPQYSYTTAVGLFQSVVNLILIISANAASRKISETSFF